MIPNNMKLSVCTALFLFYLGTSLTLAQSLQAVVLESQGDRVVINRGTADGVREGQAWILGLSDKTGAVVIEEAREHSASGRLRGKAEVGTLASLGTESDMADIVTEQLAEEQLTQTGRPDSATLSELRREYKQALRARTERRGFVTQLRGGGPNLQAAQMMTMGVEAYNVYRMYDLTRNIGLDPTGFSSPWWMALSAANMVGNQISQKRMNDSQKVRVDVEVIHWDEKLVDIQTEVAAAEQGLSIADTLGHKVLMQQKRGVDKYTVFEVSMKNVGKLPAQTGQFKYKMFLVSSEDRPISASRVDPVLDKTLNPGDEVRGMVYFPKIVAAGQSHLKVQFEQMFGDRGELKFKVH